MPDMPEGADEPEEPADSEPTDPSPEPADGSEGDNSPPEDWEGEDDGSSGDDGPPEDWETEDEESSEDEDETEEPIGDPEYASVDDLGLTRDGKANRNPVDEHIENVGMGQFIPMNYGDAQKYFGEDEVAEADADTIARVWRNHVVKPDVAAQTGIGRVRASTIKNMSPMVPANTLEALMKASGIEADVTVDDQGGATVDMSEQGN